MTRPTAPKDECVIRSVTTSLGDFTLLRARYFTQHFARHSHEELPVGVIESGALGFHYRGANTAAHRGMVSIANPDDPHNGYAVGESGWSYRMFYLSPSLVSSVMRGISDTRVNTPLFPLGTIRDDRLASALSDLHRMYESSPTSDIEREELLLDIMKYLITSHSTDRIYERNCGAEPMMVERIKEYLRAHADQLITLADLSRITGLSPFYLSRSFRSATGLPPSEYLTQLRVRHARALLAGNTSLSQIALNVGFSDQSHFTRRFKSIEGITPAAYRKIIQDRIS